MYKRLYYSINFKFKINNSDVSIVENIGENNLLYYIRLKNNNKIFLKDTEMHKALNISKQDYINSLEKYNAKLERTYHENYEFFFENIETADLYTKNFIIKLLIFNEVK